MERGGGRVGEGGKGRRVVERVACFYVGDVGGSMISSTKPLKRMHTK